MKDVERMVAQARQAHIEEGRMDMIRFISSNRVHFGQLVITNDGVTISNALFVNVTSGHDPVLAISKAHNTTITHSGFVSALNADVFVLDASRNDSFNTVLSWGRVSDDWNGLMPEHHQEQVPATPLP